MNMTARQEVTTHYSQTQWLIATGSRELSPSACGRELYALWSDPRSLSVHTARSEDDWERLLERIRPVFEKSVARVKAQKYKNHPLEGGLM